MRAVGIALALLAGGCASIVEGTTQQIYVDLVPEAADCQAYRVYEWESYRPPPRTGIPEPNLVLMGTYSPATRSIMVGKSRHDLLIRCTAPGYRNKEIRLVSNASGWGVAGALTLDFGLVDYMTGALNKYDDSIQIVMEPAVTATDGPPQPVPAPPAVRRPTF